MEVYKDHLCNEDGTNIKDKRITSVFLKSHSNSEQFQKLTESEKKMVYARKLALLGCESYISFNALVSPGVKRFLMSTGAKLEHFPTDRTLLGSALEDVYDQCLKRVKAQIKAECPAYCAISTDGWSDTHLGNSYINYNLIYKFTTGVKTTLLEVAPYDDTKSGVNLSIDLKRVLKEFNILDRYIFIINDSASCNVKAFEESMNDPELNIVGRIACIAHHIHNLVFTDIFKTKDKEFNKKIVDLKNLMSKLGAIHQSCHYKKAEMDEIFKTFCTEDKWKLILEHEEEFSDFDWENFTNDSAPKLKKNNATRWNSTLNMLRSFLPLVDVLNRILCDNDKMQLMIQSGEKKVIQELVEILELFEESVNVCQVCIFLVKILRSECFCFVLDKFLFIFKHYDLLFT